VSASRRAEQLLSTLLGPCRPEVSCEECFEQLDRFVELELAGRDAERTLPRVRSGTCRPEAIRPG
jgi:hypothetical protein